MANTSSAGSWLPVSDQASDPAQRQLPVPGANDGASGVALLIALADVHTFTER